jgi:hypothetical protein
MAFIPKYDGYLGTDALHVNNNAVEISSTKTCSLVSPLIIKNDTDPTKLATITVANTGITTISGVDGLTFPNTTTVDVANVTASTTRTTGALVVAGGVGMAKNLTTQLLQFNPVVPSVVTQSYLSLFAEWVSTSLFWHGPFTADVAGSIYISRIGNMVNIYAPYAYGAATVAGQSVTSTVAIPAVHRPANDDDVVGTCNVLNGGVTVTGSWTVHSSGIVEIWAGLASVNLFASTGADDGIRFSGNYFIY